MSNINDLDFQNRQRIVWVDIAKGVAILAILIFHSGFLPLQKQLLSLLTPWMVSIFAVLSGILLHIPKPKNNYQYLKKKIKELIFPYYLVGCLTFIFWFFLRWYAVHPPFFSPADQAFNNFIFGKEIVFNGPLWFLPSYFLSTVTLYFFRKKVLSIPNWVLLVTSFVLIYVSTIVNPLKIKTTYSADISMLFLGFSLFGIFIAKLNPKKNMFVLVSLLILFFVISFKNGTIDIFERKYGTILLFWLQVTSGSGVVLMLSSMLSSTENKIHQFFAFLGKNSFVILCSHYPIMQILTFVLYKVGVLSAINGIPSYASFSYFIQNKYVFTAIEIPLLVLYVFVPILSIKLIKGLHYKNARSLPKK